MLALLETGRGFGWYEAWLIFGFAIGAALMRGAGCAVNDIVDRDFDAQVARTASRPIPSGQISPKQAAAFVIGICLVSLSILLTMNLMAVLLGFLSLFLVAAYPFMKRITWWPQAWLGLTFNWGAVLGFAGASVAAPLAMTGFVSPAALVLYAGGLFWTLGYDTIYALQDIEDDVMAGVKSSARRLGSKVREGVAIFYALAFVLAGVSGWLAKAGPLFWVFLGFYGLHFVWQVARLRPENPVLALKLFKSNREAGLILLAAIALSQISF